MWRFCHRFEGLANQIQGNHYQSKLNDDETTEAKVVEVHLPIYHSENTNIDTDMVKNLYEAPSNITMMLGDLNVRNPT